MPFELIVHDHLQCVVMLFLFFFCLSFDGEDGIYVYATLSFDTLCSG